MEHLSVYGLGAAVAAGVFLLGALVDRARVRATLAVQAVFFAALWPLWTVAVAVFAALALGFAFVNRRTYGRRPVSPAGTGGPGADVR